MYETAEEAKMRLGTTIVIHDGVPIYVESIYNNNGGQQYEVDRYGYPVYGEDGLRKPLKKKQPKGLYARVMPLPAMRVYEDYPLDDGKWEVYNLPLGYCNTPNGAYYIQRMPCRKYKQGVCAENAAVKDVLGQPKMGFNSLMKTKGFVEMLQRKYPTYEEARRQLEENPDVPSVAFDRRFALSRDQDLGFYVLLHRGKRVAWGDPSGLIVPSEHERLRELMNQHGVTSK